MQVDYTHTHTHTHTHTYCLYIIYFILSFIIHQYLSLLITLSMLFSHSVMCNFLWPTNWSMPGFPVLHHLPELAQTHDAIQASHPLSSTSPPAFNPSQHQHLFQWVSYSHQVAKVLEFQFQYQSFQWIFRIYFL